jgi:hypothetical protein
MTDNLAYLTERLPAYSGYAEETDRHESDMRVRAFVGEKVSEALERLADRLSTELADAGQHLLEECMFTDQAFIRRIEHADLDIVAQAALVAADQRLVEVAGDADSVTPEEFAALLARIERQFALRYEPLPATI